MEIRKINDEPENNKSVVIVEIESNNLWESGEPHQDIVGGSQIVEVAFCLLRRNKGQAKPTLSDEHLNSVIEKYKLKESLPKNSHE